MISATVYEVAGKLSQTSIFQRRATFFTGTLSTRWSYHNRGHPFANSVNQAGIEIGSQFAHVNTLPLVVDYPAVDDHIFQQMKILDMKARRLEAGTSPRMFFHQATKSRKHGPADMLPKTTIIKIISPKMWNSYDVHLK